MVGKRYPWRDNKSFGRNHANYRDIGGKDKWDKQTAPVGSFEANGYGLYDMAGNTEEWCADRRDGNYYSVSPVKNPIGPSTGGYRVLRGGAWARSYLQVAYRPIQASPSLRFNFFGFRCVIDVDSNGNPELNPEGKIWNGN